MKLVFNTKTENARDIQAKLMKVIYDAEWDLSHKNESGTLTQVHVASRFEGISHKADQMLFAMERDKQIKVLVKPEVR